MAVVMVGVCVAGLLAVCGGGPALTASVCLLAVGMAEVLKHPEDYL